MCKKEICHQLLTAAGGKRGHKGRGKSFTNPEALERQRVKDEKEREWRKQRGEIDSETSEDEVIQTF